MGVNCIGNIVLFFYPKNDFLEFRTERKNKILAKYMKKESFTQDLPSVQEKIDLKIEGYIDSWMESGQNVSEYKIYQLPALSRVTMQILSSYLSNNVKKDYFSYLSHVKQYLQQKKKKIIVACIPDYSDFLNKNSIDSCSENEKFFSLNNIDYINPFKELSKKSIKSLYPYGINAHFSKGGYKAYVENILEDLKLFLDSKSN